MRLREGNVFSVVCLSMGGGGVGRVSLVPGHFLVPGPMSLPGWVGVPHSPNTYPLERTWDKRYSSPGTTKRAVRILLVGMFSCILFALCACVCVCV